MIHSPLGALRRLFGREGKAQKSAGPAQPLRQPDDMNSPVGASSVKQQAKSPGPRSGPAQVGGKDIRVDFTKQMARRDVLQSEACPHASSESAKEFFRGCELFCQPSGPNSVERGRAKMRAHSEVLESTLGAEGLMRRLLDPELTPADVLKEMSALLDEMQRRLRESKGGL